MKKDNIKRQIAKGDIKIMQVLGQPFKKNNSSLLINIMTII